MVNNYDRYESLESCRYVGVNPANENVYYIIETEGNKGCRVSIITNCKSEKIIREVRLSNRGRLQSYIDNDFGGDN